MQKNAIVRYLNKKDSKNKNTVIVEPIAFTECAACHEKCSRKGYTVPAVNIHNFDLKEGSLVIIKSSKVQEALESIICLLFPIASAILGFCLANPIYSLIKKGGTPDTACPEGLKSLIVLVFFVLASLLVYILSRARKLLIYPEITDVLEQEN